LVNQTVGITVSLSCPIKPKPAGVPLGFEISSCLATLLSSSVRKRYGTSNFAASF